MLPMKSHESKVRSDAGYWNDALFHFATKSFGFVPLATIGDQRQLKPSKTNPVQKMLDEGWRGSLGRVERPLLGIRRAWRLGCERSEEGHTPEGCAGEGLAPRLE